MEIFFTLLVCIVIWIIFTGKRRRRDVLYGAIIELINSGATYTILHGVYFEAALKYALENGARLEPSQSAIHAENIQFPLQVNGVNYLVYFSKMPDGSTYIGVRNSDEERRKLRERLGF